MKDVNLLINNNVNVKKSLELFGDMQTYDELLFEFLNIVDEKISKIKTYKEIGDMANYAILSHSLKSDARTFGFEKLAEIAYQHEMAGKSNDIYFVTEHFNEFMNEASFISNLVKQYFGKTSPMVNNLNQDNNVNNLSNTILVVDDSTIIVSYIEKMLGNEYNVKIANDGQEALNIIKNDSSNIIAMLLDLNMPNVNGYQVLDYFKENNLFKKIPVSIITGEDSKDSINKVFKYPIIDVLSKPFNEARIKEIINKMLNFK